MYDILEQRGRARRKATARLKVKGPRLKVSALASPTHFAFSKNVRTCPKHSLIYHYYCYYYYYH